jgi:hypothetical protein
LQLTTADTRRLLRTGPVTAEEDLDIDNPIIQMNFREVFKEKSSRNPPKHGRSIMKGLPRNSIDAIVLHRRLLIDSPLLSMSMRFRVGIYDM